MADKILYANKEKLLDDITIPAKNKVTADDMNEIKNVANAHADDIDELYDVKANRTEIPTDLSQLSNATTKFVNETQLSEAIEGEESARELADEDLQGQINSINDDISALDDRVETNEDDIADINLEQTVQDNEIGELKLESGHTIELSLNTTNYELTAKLKNKSGTILNTSTIDLPLETMIINVEYDNTNKQLIITLQNGNKIYVPIADIISGLQTEITSENMLSSDLVDDNNHAHKFMSNSEKTKLEGIETGAEVNVIEVIKVDGTAIPVTDKTVNIDLSAKEDKSNKVISLSNQSTDVQYPSAKAVYDSQVEQDNEIEVLRNTVDSELEDATSTGTSITVNDSANAPAKLLPGGRTEQNQYEGKNLANIYVIPNQTSDIKITVENETITIKDVDNIVGYTNTNKKLSEICPALQVDDVVYLFFNTTSSSTSKNIIYIDQSWANGSSKTITQAMLDSNVVLYGGHDETAVISNFMITTSSNNSYEPYVGGQPSPSPDYPQTIHNLSGNNQIKIQNKNLWNPQKVVSDTNLSNTYITTDGKWIHFVTGSYRLIFYPEAIKTNTQYTLKIHLKNGDSSNTIILTAFYTDGTNDRLVNVEASANQEYVVTASTLANKTLDYIQSAYTSGKEAFIKIEGTQLEEGTTATPYVPHKEQTAEFTLVEGQKMFEEDYLADDGIHHKRQQLVLDGTENWEQGISAKVFYLSLPNRTYSKTPQNGCISNYFIGIPYKTGLAGINKGEITLFSSGTAANPYLCELYINYDTTATVEQFKQFLAEKYANGNPVIVEFDAYEETIEPYTELQQQQYNRLKKMISYYQQTNVNTISAEDLEPILNFEYKKSNRLRIEAIENAIISLGGNV